RPAPGWRCSRDLTSASLADADLVARGVDLVADPRRPAAVRAHQRHVGHVDRHVLVDDPALLVGPGRALVLAGGVDALDDHPVLAGQGADDLALLAPVLAGEDADAVALADLEPCHHSARRASEMIFMNRLSRGSRPRGPKMRVPRGFRSLLMRTAAFSSKRMWLPSGRRRSFLVRTTTQ